MNADPRPKRKHVAPATTLEDYKLAADIRRAESESSRPSNHTPLYSYAMDRTGDVNPIELNIPAKRRKATNIMSSTDRVTFDSIPHQTSTLPLSSIIRRSLEETHGRQRQKQKEKQRRQQVKWQEKFNANAITQHANTTASSSSSNESPVVVMHGVDNQVTTATAAPNSRELRTNERRTLSSSPSAPTYSGTARCICFYFFPFNPCHFFHVFSGVDEFRDYQSTAIVVGGICAEFRGRRRSPVATKTFG